MCFQFFSSLRREPTPFPKEMRAMAKRAKKLREQQQQQQEGQLPPQQQPQQHAEDVAQRKKGKEHRPRMQRKCSTSHEPEENNVEENKNGFGPNLAPKMPNANYGPTIDQKVRLR